MTDLSSTAPARSRVLFAVDHIFRTTGDGSVYTMGGKFPYGAWKSYLDTFGAIRVVARGRGGDDVRSLSLSSGDSVDFVLCSASRGAGRLASIFDNRKLAKEEVAKADLVIVRLPSELGLAASEAAHAMGKPVFVEMVACPWDSLWNNGGLVARLYAPVLWARTRRAAAMASMVRYVTAAFLQRRYPTRGRSFVASNVELNDIRAPHEARTAPRELARPLVFGTIGALQTRIKGIHTAIAALGRLHRERPGLAFVYHVLGEGETGPLLALAREAGIKDYVVFDGTLPADGSVLDWLDGISIISSRAFRRDCRAASSRRRAAAASASGRQPVVFRSCCRRSACTGLVMSMGSRSVSSL